jgi:hypothetical protein
MSDTLRNNRQTGEQTKQVKYRMEIYFPEVYDTIEAPLTQEQVQMYSDFIREEREKYDQRTEFLDYTWDGWLRDAFLEANFTYPLLLAGEEPIDAEVLYLDLEHPIEER